jgi:hypothetical protein
MSNFLSNSDNLFGKIKNIVPEDGETYRGKKFITFDIDLAHDEVLEDTIDLVEEADIAATWFVTHDTTLLSRLRKNKKFEIGIHPNFNFLLQGDYRNGYKAEEVIDRLLNIVPEAKSVRSHSITQSSLLIDIFQQKGLSHDCNYFIPYNSEIEIKPWYLYNGMIEVPYLWEDDVELLSRNPSSIKKILFKNELSVINFHPIHVYLNTDNMDRYEETISIHNYPKQLIGYRNNREGIRSILKKLIQF